MYFFIFGFITAIVVATVVWAMVLQERSKEIDVKISDFEDLRLKEVLDSARKKDSDYNVHLLLSWLSTIRYINK